MRSRDGVNAGDEAAPGQGHACLLSMLGVFLFRVQGYLARKKHPPPRTLQQDHAQGHMVVIG